MGKLKEEAEKTKEPEKVELVATAEGNSGKQEYFIEKPNPENVLSVAAPHHNSLSGKKDQFSNEKIELIKATCCKGATDTELEMFLHACQRTGLDPMLKQIHAVKRFDKSQNREVMSIQVGIDGYRLIAERTGRYAPGKDTEYQYDKGGHLLSAKAFVKKQTNDGTWHEVGATAFFNEQVQTSREGRPTMIWGQMPHVMLAKCFSNDTQVLTNQGFRLFEEIKDEKIMQVTELGLESVEAKPFSQNYHGEMIAYHSSKLDFSVTPNHDMVTTFGKVEASALYDTTTFRGPWKIPMAINVQALEPANPKKYQLLGYLLADGSYRNKTTWQIQVSRNYKVKELSKFSESQTIVHCKGNIAKNEIREIRSNFDKVCFSFNEDFINHYLDKDKNFNPQALDSLSYYEARLILDAWQYFDGHTNKKTGVRRIYTSKESHCGLIEILACKAGYSISSRKIRYSDISESPNFYFTLSDIKDNLVVKPWRNKPGIIKEQNTSGKVWCVTVPSGKIIVRKNGFSFICGNCAEIQALKKCFPNELSGIQTESTHENEVVPHDPNIGPHEIKEIIHAIGKETELMDKILKWAGVQSLRELKKSQLGEVLRGIEANKSKGK